MNSAAHCKRLLSDKPGLSCKTTVYTASQHLHFATPMCIQTVSNLCPQKFFLPVAQSPNCCVVLKFLSTFFWMSSWIFLRLSLQSRSLNFSSLLAWCTPQSPDQNSNLLQSPGISYFATSQYTRHKTKQTIKAMSYLGLGRKLNRGEGFNPSHDIWAVWWVGGFLVG